MSENNTKETAAAENSISAATVLSDTKKAIICVILSAFFFALMSFMIRMVGDLPTYQKAFFRNAIALLFILPSFFKQKCSFNIGKQNLRDLFIRSAFGTMGVLCNYYAIDHMSLSDSNMLNKLSPFFSVLMAILILKEKPTRSDWLAIVIAFSGALLIIKPSMNMHFAYAMIGVFGGFCAGSAYVFVRKLSKSGVKNPVIILGFCLFSCTFMLPFTILCGSPMSAYQLLFLFLAGLSAAGGQIFVTKAYSLSEVRKVSVFGYTQVIFAALLGIIFLGQTPDILSFIGYIVIIGSAVMKSRS